MSARSKTTNIVALLIAVILIAIGFALNFIHEQSESAEKQAPSEKTGASIIQSVPKGQKYG